MRRLRLQRARTAAESARPWSCMGLDRVCSAILLVTVSLPGVWAGNPQPPAVVVLHADLSDNGDHDGWADTNETVTMRITVRLPLWRTYTVSGSGACENRLFTNACPPGSTRISSAGRSAASQTAMAQSARTPSA